MKTGFPKFASLKLSRAVFPNFLEKAPLEIADETLPNREEIYRQGYEAGCKDVMEKAQKANKEALEVMHVILNQVSNIELSENAIENICQHLVELFESAFKRLFLACPSNLNEVVKALLDTLKSKQIAGRVKVEVSEQGYEKLKEAGCIAWPNAELCINSELDFNQCRLSYLDVVVEYDKKFLQSQLDSVLGCAKFTYHV